MLSKINDVRSALKNKTYYSALALALTFPDICCQVEKGLKGKDESRGTDYIAWVNAHMDVDDFHFPIKGFEKQTFDGVMCYALRCKVLHNGNTDLQASRQKILVDDFVLTKPDDPKYYHGYKYGEETKEDGTTKTITYIGIDYLCERLCDATENFYNEWKNKTDFNIHLF